MPFDRKITDDEARAFLDILRDDIKEAIDNPEEFLKDNFDFDMWDLEDSRLLIMTMYGATSSQGFSKTFVEIDPVRMALVAVVHWLQWSQDDVAEFLQLSKARVSQYMNGENPIPKRRAHEIRRLLKIASMQWFMARISHSVGSKKLHFQVSENRALAREHISKACKAILADLTDYLDNQDDTA